MSSISWNAPEMQSDSGLITPHYNRTTFALAYHAGRALLYTAVNVCGLVITFLLS